MKSNLILIVALILFRVFSLQAQTAPVKTLVHMETQANGVAVRSEKRVPIHHFEIPLRLVTQGKEVGLDEKTYSSMVFNKNGEEYIRWVINPEDTKWYKSVEEFMKNNGITPVRKSYFKGYQTASRSYIVVDPVSGAQFSIKTSTNQTGGNWKDKKQEYQDAFDILKISDLMTRLQKVKPFTNFSVMHEPLVFGIENVDQSIVIRDLGKIARSDKFLYVPGFSVLHEEEGKRIALLNGSTDPATFWQKNYVEPMARAAAEMIARTGIWFDSPHSQNFLVEMTSDYKPTGRVVLRDLGDIYINKSVMNAFGEHEILKEFSAQGNISENIKVGFGPLHGNVNPSWVNQEIYGRWAATFHQIFAKEYKRRTGVGVMNSYKSNWGYSYFGTNVNTKSDEFLKYKSSLKSAARWCRKIYTH